MTYTVRTNTYGKHHAGYVPVFQNKSLKMVGQFLAIEGNNFMPNIQTYSHMRAGEFDTHRYRNSSTKTRNRL